VITTDGKLLIKRYLAKQVGDIGKSIAVGLGPKAEAVGDTSLQFEMARADVTLISYDFVNNKIIFKASIPQELAGKIYEVGLWSLAKNTAAGDFMSRVLTSFDSNSEVWSTGTFQTANARMGADSLRLTPAASTTALSAITDLFIDLSGNSGADKFSIAYYNANANVANFKVRFKTDASNYYTITVTSPATGYQISQVAKSAAVVTGTPNWVNISSVEVEATSGSGGSSSIDFDGIRIEDIDTLNPDYVMVSRELLAAPLTKIEGRVMDIEFSLPVTIT
jgi:hypothetical protein